MTGKTPQRTGGPSSRIGVGIDNSRYGHYATFLRDDLQAAAAELSFAESAPGYAQLQKRLCSRLNGVPGLAASLVRRDSIMG
jgi:hypothetical protein